MHQNQKKFLLRRLLSFFGCWSISNDFVLTFKVFLFITTSKFTMPTLLPKHNNLIFAKGSPRSVESSDDDELPQEKVFTFDDVRITPSYMLFDNAYEGKHYKERLVIQNCGSRLAFIRLCEPNSKTFEFASFTSGQYLSPGIKITRTVHYTYRRTGGVLKGFTTIWVNGKEMRYHFVVKLSKSILSLEPQLLDFGRIDAVNHATTRIFYIKNSGFKGTHFAIDMAKNALEMTIEPRKGVLPARSSVAIKVEIVGKEEGEFLEELWVKSDPPLRVVMMGAFISPKLLVRKFINSLDFTLLDFPPTYYGSTSTQPLLIKNFSSSHSMFCVMAEIKGSIVTLDEARKIDDNYRNFIIKPIDGRLSALKGAIIQMTFAPIVTRARKDKNYAACFLKVIRMDCRDVTPSDAMFAPSAQPSSITAMDSESIQTNLTREISNLSAVAILNMTPPQDESEENFSFEHAIGVCVHGEKEYAAVVLRPTLMTLEGLVLEKVYRRELLIMNNSTHLPLRVKYNKSVCIDVHPNEFDLAGGHSLVVSVTIRAVSLSREEKKITFDLLAEDFPKKGTFKRVGQADLSISFAAREVERKPGKKQCVCDKLPLTLKPELPHRLTRVELQKKMQHNDFWLAYIRSLQSKPKQDTADWHEYELSQSKLGEYGGECGKIVRRNKEPLASTSFYPLAPRLLYNVKITPKSIRLRKVAAFTTVTDFFVIENRNTFPIFVNLKSSKSFLFFEGDTRYSIAPKEKKKMYFSFSTCSTGRYYINIYVLVNYSTLYEVTAVAQVVPKTLKLDTETIEFTEQDRKFKFFKIINSLNAYTSFDWEISAGSFTLCPSAGGIKAEKFLLCAVTYWPNPIELNTSECVLTSESGQKRNLLVTYKRRQTSVVFDTYSVNFDVIPLNMPVRKKLTLMNLKEFPILYSIPNEISVPGITINPTRGILEGLDSQVFIISVLLQAVIQFEIDIVFQIDEGEEVKINLKGCVEYPDIILKPETLFFRKIAPYSFDTLAFKVTNVSKGVVWISFIIDEVPEFSVTDSEDDQYKHLGKVVLQVEETKILFLHFHPNYVSTYALLLPYVVNDIIGPAFRKSSSSATPVYFLQEEHLRYGGIRGVTIKKIPRSLALIRVNCSAIDKTLEFSSLNIRFFYFGEGHCNNMTSTTFEITNVTTETAAVCIRIDDLGDPFALAPTNDVEVEYYEVSYKINLEPGQTVSFNAEFFPMEKGDYEIELPIFLRHYYDNKIFNYLTLHGVYDTPVILPSTQHCDFEPVPLNTNSQLQIRLHMFNHFENCKISAKSDWENLNVRFEERTISKVETLMDVTLHYECSHPTCFNTIVQFCCSCDSTCVVEVTGVVENCLLTTHAFYFLITQQKDNDDKTRKSSMDEFSHHHRPRSQKQTLTNRNTTCFPLFPTDDDTSAYANYMRNLQKALEQWLFSQGFYFKGYYRIPEGFSEFCKVREPLKKRIFGGLMPPKVSDMPLLQLIMNIAGKDIRDKLAPSFPKDLEETTWLSYVSKTNANILRYLEDFPVSLPHVKAKYLLNYDQYVQYENIKRPKQKPMDEAIFYRLSKQCWIDLILQIIKAFFFFRTVPYVPPVSEENLTAQRDGKRGYSFISVSKISFDAEEEIFIEMDVYGEREKALKEWLRVCYSEEKSKLWSPPPADKDLVFLKADLQDGLVLGAVTAHYCPYVRSEIKQMYTASFNPEEIFHNICVLVKTWQMLNFSYVISPSQLSETEMVEILLIVSYLYDILPHYSPCEDIKIEALLTQSNVSQLDLVNLGEDPIYYKEVFFGNDSHLFTVLHDNITVEPRQSKALKVRFHAKSVRTSLATLVLCGETPGHKFGKSIAVNIVGIPDVSYACMEIPVTVELYKPCEIVFDLQSPFKVEADYLIYVGYQHVSQEKNVLFPWEELKRLKTVKEFVLESSVAHFNSQGQCVVKHAFCCQHIEPRDMWIYFTNPDVGDWGIKVTMTGTVTKDCYERLSLVVPENYENLVCRCKIKPCVTTNCPMILYLTIPMKNVILWHARKKMVMQYVQGEEYKFWFKRIYTPTGTRILKLILNSETHPMRQTTEETVTYQVKLPNRCPFVTLKTVVFEDITSEDTFQLPVHPVKNLLKASKCTLELISEKMDETRFYEVVFKSGKESS